MRHVIQPYYTKKGNLGKHACETTTIASYLEDKIIRSEVEKVKKRVEALEKELVRNKNNLFSVR